MNENAMKRLAAYLAGREPVAEPGYFSSVAAHGASPSLQSYERLSVRRNAR